MHDVNKRFINSNNDEKNESIFGIKASKNQSNQIQSVVRKLEKTVKQIEGIVGDLRLKVCE